MRISYSESLTVVEATAEEIRSSQSLKDTFQRVLNNMFGNISPAEEDLEEEPEEDPEE